MKQIEALGRKMSDVLHGHYGPGTNRDQMVSEVNDELAKLAMEITGVRADQLADENLDDKPIVRLYWTTVSELTAKMFMSAAQSQSYYRQADR